MPGATDRDFYNEVAERLPSPQLIFLNYGYAGASSEPCLWIAPADQRHKCHLNLVKHVMSDVELAGLTVLEVGSGRGGNCHYLSRYTQAKAIYGVDRCEPNVRFCRAVHRLPNVTFVSGDAEQLPFRSEAFDVVLNLESSHCYPHFEQFLAEVHRVLKPHGTFCYADLWFLEFLELDWRHRKKALDAAPFVLLSEEDISEPVWQALASKEGLLETIRSMANETNREFVEEIVQRLKLVRLTIAARHLSYLAWKFRKS
jgi:O-methyltransferase